MAFTLYPTTTLPKRFNAATDISNLGGKVILVTGGNNGLGKQSILELARHNPARIWLAARDLSKASMAKAEINGLVPDANIKLLQLDLASFTSVKQAVERILADEDHLDMLMLNAGIMATPPGLTEEGYEIQFGTNHMGHALLTKLLIPILCKSAQGPGADVRIISLTSHSHVWAPKGGIEFDRLKTTFEILPSYNRYAQSKLANILWVRHMAKLYPELKIVAVHPGVVDTGLSSGATNMGWLLGLVAGVIHRFAVSVEEGVKNQLWAATARGVVSGVYYEPIGEAGKGSKEGRDGVLAKKLGEWTERELDAWVCGMRSSL